MLTPPQIRRILAAPGSYRYWCVVTPHGDPFWSHTPVGHVLFARGQSEKPSA